MFVELLWVRVVCCICVVRMDSKVYYDLRFRLCMVTQLAVQPSRQVLAAVALALVALGVAAAVTAYGVLSSGRTVQSYGAVKAVNVGVYWNSGCTNVTSSVDWGLLSPGTSKNVTLYVRNEGNTVVGLSVACQSWSPAVASAYIGLAWNREGQTVSVGSVLMANLSLSVSSSVAGITSFSFDIVITGTEL
jgi:hypothetical protein